MKSLIVDKKKEVVLTRERPAVTSVSIESSISKVRLAISSILSGLLLFIILVQGNTVEHRYQGNTCLHQSYLINYLLRYCRTDRDTH